MVKSEKVKCRRNARVCKKLIKQKKKGYEQNILKPESYGRFK